MSARLLALAFALALVPPAGLEPRSAHASELVQANPLVDGEVRRIDKENGKVTLRHAPIPNLDMGAMTMMVFRVKEPSMLERMSVGQKIRFEAARHEGQLTVMRFEAVP